MKPADDFQTTFMRWQQAERAVRAAQDELDRAIRLYLTRRGGAPTATLADALAARRRDAMHALALAHDAVSHCRGGLPIL